MPSYTVTSEMAGYGSKQMPKRILAIAVTIIASEILAIQWNARSGAHFQWQTVVFALVGGAIGPLLAELWEVASNYPYTLVVTDDCVTAVYRNREKSIRKNEIRSVTEIEGNCFRVAGLQISKHGRLGTRLWGCIFVPRALPEYEPVRSVALSWRNPTSI